MIQKIQPIYIFKSRATPQNINAFKVQGSLREIPHADKKHNQSHKKTTENKPVNLKTRWAWRAIFRKWQHFFFVMTLFSWMHSETLRVADEVDPVCGFLHDWVNSSLESLHLLPHGLQAGRPVKQVDDRHICARVRLQKREILLKKNKKEKKKLGVVGL